MLKHMIIFAAVAGLVLALAPAAHADVQIAPGNLLGYWTFDDDTVNDSSGNNYHGTTNGTWSTDVPPGLSGKSINFTGNNYATVSTGGTEDVFDLDTFSVGFWVNGVATWGSYVAKADNSIADGWMVGNFDNKDQLAVRMRGTSAADTAPYGWQTTIFSAGTWRYLTYTYDGADMVAYVDGVQFDTDPCTGSITDNALPLVFGSVLTTWKNSKKMDEITVFDRALTAAEVSLLYDQGGYPLPEPATLALLGLGGLGILIRRRRRA